MGYHPFTYCAKAAIILIITLKIHLKMNDGLAELAYWIDFWTNNPKPRKLKSSWKELWDSGYY